MGEIFVTVVLIFVTVLIAKAYKEIQGRDPNYANYEKIRDLHNKIKEEDAGQYKQSVDPMLLSGPKDRKSPLTLIWLIWSQFCSVLLLIIWFIF